MALINWLLKPKYMLKHRLFFCCMKIPYDDFFFLIFERLGRMHENKIFFFLKKKLQCFDENRVF
jgi:hypothetical protein